MMAVEKILQLLASLVALVGVAPAFLYLDRLVQLVVLTALVTGYLCDRRKRVLIPPLPATLLSFLFFFLYLAQMSRSRIVEPLINMLVLLLAVRLVTEKSGRNLLQIFVLSTFVLAASSLLSLSAGYLASLILLIALVTFGLLLTSFHATDPGLCLSAQQWRSLLRAGAILPAGSLLLMIFFFVMLPRTEYPLWNFLNPKANPAAGFSEEVNPGSLANLGSSGEPAFRAEMSDIDPQELYWRGLVLNQTDGRSWTRSKYPPEDLLLADAAKPRRQIIYTEPRTGRYLPGLDLPETIAGIRSERFADGVFESRQRLDKRSRYEVASANRGALQMKNRQQSDYYLKTPQQVAPRVRAVATETSKLPDRKARIQALSAFFSRQQLSYAARNLQLSETPVETFLFESKRGYCEYFASSYALLLRLSGVPARLVGGYLGGRYNELGGYYLVDEDMAHVWVEALDDDGRWQRIDPSRLAINAAEAVTGLARSPFNWSQSATDYLDIAWSRLVLTYDLQQQLELAFSAGRGLRNLSSVRPGDYLGWLAVITLLLAAVQFCRMLPFNKKRHQRLLQGYLRQVAKSAGMKQLPPSLGLFELAERSREPLCHEFARIYGGALYAERPLSAEQLHQLRHILKQLKSKRIGLTAADPCAEKP